ncbi:dihydrolipoamide acetyltransferase family protein [Gemmatimonadota bacterium]
MYEFKLPDLGEGIHEGEVLQWHVQVNGKIKEDDPLVEIETDKAAVTIPSPKGGTVVALTGDVGDTVNVGQVIAVIDDGTGAAVAAQPKEAVSAADPTVPAAVAAVSPDGTRRPVPAAPATRRLARELGIDINVVVPSGPAGRVTPDDVKAAAQGRQLPAVVESSALVAKPEIGVVSAETEFAAHAASAIPFLDIDPLPDFSQWGPVEKERLRSIRRRVAHRMTTSTILVPHVAHMDDADVTALEEFRAKANASTKEDGGVHLTLLAFVVKAVTAGLKAAPVFNSSLDPFNEEIVYKKYYNVGIAVDTGRGLIVPVVRNTDCKSIRQIAADIKDVATRARDGKIDVADLQGSTFTITNVGPLGGTALIPTINYPEVAILGMGSVRPKPVVRDGEIVIRTILPLTLAFDHRVADGADAARFVAELARQLSDPNLLLVEA